MYVREADLTSYARIRNSALELFARKGIAATSIREVAAATGVSPGLVQHHFKTKAALGDAVNEYVIELARESFTGIEESSGDAIEEAGKRLTAFIRDHPTAELYVARLAAEGDEGALQIFDAFVDIAKRDLEQLSERGLLRSDLDMTWAALYVCVWNLGTVLLEHAVNRHLPEPFFSAEGLERWNEWSTGLFKQGASRPARSRKR